VAAGLPPGEISEARSDHDVSQEGENVETNEAFQIIIRELKSALDAAREQGERAFKERRYAEAQKNASSAEQLEKDLQALTTSYEHWRGRQSRPRAVARIVEQPVAVHTARALRGARTPEAEFRLPILQALVNMGGSGIVRNVLDQVGKLMEGRFTPVDFEVIETANEVRWRNTAKWERSRMVRQGLLRSDSPIGTWEITDEGRRIVREGREKK